MKIRWSMLVFVGDLPFGKHSPSQAWIEKYANEKNRESLISQFSEKIVKFTSRNLQKHTRCFEFDLH